MQKINTKGEVRFVALIPNVGIHGIHSIQSIWNFCHTNQIWKDLGSATYLQPLFLNYVLTSCYRSLIFQTLISVTLDGVSLMNRATERQVRDQKIDI